ncbi:MAG: single-stranded DNA-binding protein [Cyanobacteria bacterium P01_H01_bin.152]
MSQPQELTTLLLQMANRLEAIASQTPPNWQLPLKFYRGNWCDRIAATALENDEHGPTKVLWCGHCYTRRTGENPKYGAAIWFSRSVGNGDYGRLITFSDTSPASPLPEYVRRALSNT